MSLQPRNYQEALERKQSQDARRRSKPLQSRQPMKRGGGLRRVGDPKLTAWSREIRRRDGYCRWPQCSRLGPAVTVDAHHKAPRSLRPDLKYDLENGILLCRHHHNFAHGQGKTEAIALGILNLESQELARKNRIAQDTTAQG